MRLIEFPGHTVVIAKDQPEYFPMPAHISREAVVTCCWRLTARERWRILWRGIVWHQIMTFGDRVQPQILQTERPAELDVYYPDESEAL
ncbi:MAG TPA: hypothetical protein VGL34_10845 [Steroidobacteraceae bacterium]|jgi:hypothetical protein